MTWKVDDSKQKTVENSFVAFVILAIFPPRVISIQHNSVLFQGPRRHEHGLLVTCFIM